MDDRIRALLPPFPFFGPPIGNLLLDGALERTLTDPCLPDHHPRIRRILRGRFRRPEDFFTLTTECRHWYSGFWEIDDDKLFLLSLHGYRVLIPEEPLLADWFTGVLEVLCGRSAGNLGGVYERTLKIEIKNGLVQNTRLYDNSVRFREAERRLQEIRWWMDKKLKSDG